MNNTMLKRIALLMAATVGLTVAAQGNADDVSGKYPGYKLAFQDEFDVDGAPNPDVWSFEEGMKRNQEPQVYTKDNATVKDGNLVIEARQEKVKNPGYKRYGSQWYQKHQYGEFSSASLIAKEPYKFHYGIYEIRAKIPVHRGYWPAIWSCGSKYEWPFNGEIDMLEYYGDAIHANVAWGSMNRWSATWHSKAPRMSEFESDFADKYHIWRMEWDEEAIRIYLDDRLLNETDLDMTVNPNPGQDWYNVDNYNPYRDPEQLHGVWLNLALGDNTTNYDTNLSAAKTAPYPAQYLIDYVRVYVPDGSIYTSLYRLISKAEKELAGTTEGDAPGQYSTAVREQLAAAIAAAEAVAGTGDQAAVDAAMADLEAALEAYSSNPFDAGSYRLRHEASGAWLSTGWYDAAADAKYEANQCVIILNDNREEGADSKGYNQIFTFEKAPEGALVDGFNIKVGENEYIYRDAWYLLVGTPSAANLKAKNYIFNVEFPQGKAVIKNEGSGKYFGTDNNWAWSHVYSDKGGAGNANAYFTLEKTYESGVADVIADSESSEIVGVYNLQGIKVGNSTEGLCRGIYIVRTADNTCRKLAL